jgi:hypothetical protein|tara:strand:+ start:2388 stop:2603 length:216 start_codon:yes stop_codon:yes gene_type:complete
MWWIFGITMFVALSCYFLQGYDRNINTFSRRVSIHFRYRWMDRRCRIMDRVLFNVAIFLMVGTFIIAIITW